jgi:2-methylisocitrate lyase-like PEP mutase family enzyme
MLATTEELIMSELQTRAGKFLELNLAGKLILPNAWDVVSARVFEQAGFPAIGTTSAGVAWSRGSRDGEHIGRDAMMREVAAIARATQCPVTADVEAGYGSSAAAVATTVEAVLDAGAVGINLEDAASDPGSKSLFSVAEQSARVAAAREVAERKGVHLVINARTDTFLLGLGETPEERVAMTIERGVEYLRAGADIVFVPYLLDVALISQVARSFNGRLSLMATPDAPSAAELFAAGAKRVSLGPIAMLATLGLLRDIATEARQSGSWRTIAQHGCAFRDVEGLFSR